ncbi:MAG: glutamate 5-kinase, partial [Patescibacteria group bacterium]|nr:glutamate 5-kinase [Patescibacteria group bacterium]
AAAAGIETFIVDGRQPGLLKQALQKNHPGTRFLAKSGKDMSEQKRWLMAAKGFGQLVVDDGAAAALGNFKSLLLPGIISTRGIFDKGEVVEIVGKNGLAIAYGRSNYGSGEIQTAMNLRKALGKSKTLDKEVVHRDYMIMVE